MRKMKSLEELREELLSRPKLREEYDKLEDEFAQIAQKIEAKKATKSSQAPRRPGQIATA